MILQIVEDTTIPFSCDKDVCVFIRKWNPSTMVLDGHQEIIIHGE